MICTVNTQVLPFFRDSSLWNELLSELTIFLPSLSLRFLQVGLLPTFLRVLGG